MNINSDLQTQQFPFPQDRFLETAKIIPMNAPMAEVMYLDMVEEKSTIPSEFPQLNMRIKRDVIKVNTYEVTSQLPMNHKNAIQNEFGINLEDQIVSIMNNESQLTMQKQLRDIYMESGKNQNLSRLTKWQSFLHRIFKIEFPEWVDEREVVRRILALSNIIEVKSRLGPANFCVVNAQIGMFIQDDPSFVYREKSISENKNGGIVSLGSIADKIEIFLDPNAKFGDTQVILGRMTRNDEPGVIFGQYYRELLKVITEMNFEEKSSLRSRYKFHPLGKMNQYLTVDIRTEKKPFWRKLIGA